MASNQAVFNTNQFWKGNWAMTDLDKLLKDFQHRFYTIIPDDVWDKLYTDLQAEIVSYGYSRTDTLIVSRDYTHILITNVQQQLVADIPQIISDVDQVNFTDFSARLVIRSRHALKT